MSNLSNEAHWQLLVLMLRKISEKKGITQTEIAERAGLIPSNVSRVFSLQYCPNMRTFVAIAQAIGVNFFFEDKDNQTDLSQIFEAAMNELGRRPDKLPKN